MRVLLVIRQDNTEFEKRSWEEREPLIAQYMKVGQFLTETGKMIASSGLTTEGRTLRNTDGEYVVTEGPYATGNEMLNGFFLFNADSLDEAEEIARQLPTGDGNSIELRPLWDQG